MPIVVLEVPRGTWDDLPEEDREVGARALCEAVVDKIHSEFSIPDEEDKEIRVITTDGEITVLRVAFTVGPREYPGKVPEEFDPPPEEILRVMDVVSEMVEETPFGVGRTVFEPWRGSKFMMCSPENEAPPPVEEAVRRVAGEYMWRPELRVYVSPERMFWAQSRVSEEVDAGVEDPFAGSAREMAELISERLSLPEDARVEPHVVVTKEADCAISVEADLTFCRGKSLPPEVKDELAYMLQERMDENELTAEHEPDDREIWIRDGNCLRAETRFFRCSDRR